MIKRLKRWLLGEVCGKCGARNHDAACGLCLQNELDLALDGISSLTCLEKRTKRKGVVVKTIMHGGTDHRHDNLDCLACMVLKRHGIYPE